MTMASSEAFGALSDGMAAAVEAAAAGLLVIDPALRLDVPGAADARADTTDEEAHLTPCEIEVLHKLAAGLTNKAIVRALAISEHTAKSHVGGVLRSLGHAPVRKR